MPKKTKFVLSAVVAGIKAKHPAIQIEADDGTMFVCPPPQLWTDDVTAVGDDPVKSTKALLGDQYDAFLAAGGSSAILMQIIAEAVEVDDAGESSAS